jgi:hypothetical protein
MNLFHGGRLATMPPKLVTPATPVGRMPPKVMVPRAPSCGSCLVVITAVNLRAADVPTYYAAHSKNGVNVSQRLTCRMAVNKPGKQNEGKGTVQYINMTFWGKMADVARSDVVVGEPIALGEVTVVPLSRVSVGFGAGGGAAFV